MPVSGVMGLEKSRTLGDHLLWKPESSQTHLQYGRKETDEKWALGSEGTNMLSARSILFPYSAGQAALLVLKSYGSPET